MTIKQNFKYCICFLLLLLCGLLVSGCTPELPTPDSLITAPASNQELMQQKQMIAEFLGKKDRMIVPEENETGTAYQYINIDDDAENEMVVFYANNENNFVLGFMILDQQDGHWVQRYKTTAYGTDIHYFSVQDLDQDDVPEFLLGVRTGYGSMKELYVYRFSDKGLVDVIGDNHISYDQVVVAQPTDGQTMVVTARTDTTVLVGSSNITAYVYAGQSVYPIYDATFDGYCSEMRFDRVDTWTEGLYLAMRYNHYINMLLLCVEDGNFTLALEHPIPYDYEDMVGIDLFGDINYDGILELNSLWTPENNLSEKSYQEYVHVWLQWDGDAGLRAVSAVQEDKLAGYRFIIPVAWMDSLYYDFYSEREIDWVEFYYENEEHRFETVFALAAVDQLVWSEIADQMEESVVVLGNNPSKNKVYIANIETDIFNGFWVDVGTLISCLQIEGGV